MYNLNINIKKQRNTHKAAELDGRTLEGGGQLLRNAVCMSALTGTPIKIHHIRGARSGGGGLKAQHLACVNWLAQACYARTEGAEEGSQTLVFEPGKGVEDPLPSDHSPVFKKLMRDGQPVYECRVDVATAGSTGLILQAILPFILFSHFPSKIPVRLVLTGGTNVSGSPSFEYIDQVLLPTLQSIGFSEIDAKLNRRGWSQGGSSIGEIVYTIPSRETVPLPAFTLHPPESESKRSKPSHLRTIFVAPSSCHDHFRKVLQPAIEQHFGTDYATEDQSLEVKCEGSLHEKRMYLILVATMPAHLRKGSQTSDVQSTQTFKLSRDWLYDRKIRSLEKSTTEIVEYVTNALATEVESGAYVDVHMRDQLVIFQALAQGRSSVFPGLDADGERREPSLHARTAEWVAKQILGVTFDATDACDGVAFGVTGSEDLPSVEEQEDFGWRFESLRIE